MDSSEYGFLTADLLTDEDHQLTINELAEEIGLSRATWYKNRKKPLEVTRESLDRLYVAHHRLTRARSKLPAWTHDELCAIERAVCAGDTAIREYLIAHLRTIEALYQLLPQDTPAGIGAAYVSGMAKFYLFSIVDNSHRQTGEDAVGRLTRVYEWGIKNGMRPYMRARLLMRIVAAHFNLSEHAVAEDAKARESLGKLFRDVGFFEILREIRKMVPNDPKVPFNGVLAAAVIDDKGSMREFLNGLIEIDPRFKNPYFMCHGLEALGQQPIIKRFYIDELFPNRGDTTKGDGND